MLNSLKLYGNEALISHYKSLKQEEDTLDHFEKCLKVAILKNDCDAIGQLMLNKPCDVEEILNYALQIQCSFKSTLLLLLCYAVEKHYNGVIKLICKKKYLEITELDKNQYLKCDIQISTDLLYRLRSFVVEIKDYFVYPVRIGCRSSVKNYDGVKVILSNIFCDKKKLVANWRELSLPCFYEGWQKECMKEMYKNVILSFNCIESIVPTNITIYLGNVEKLNLSSNNLKNVPTELFKLPKLRNLNLSSNKLVCLPNVMEWSPYLTTLSLENNLLKSFPSNADQVPIKNLYISNNKFDCIPPGICNLMHLETLHISGNVNIHVLPLQMGKLSKLTNLNITGLKIDSPSAIKNLNSTQEIMCYLKALMRSAGPYYTMKLMIIGFAEQGKTTLLKRLQDNTSYNENQRTEGIDIQDVSIGFGLKKTFIFRVWDFAGQEEYFATHQCFLSSCSLYLLVWDATKKSKGLQLLKPWFENLIARVKVFYVIIVVTKLDLINENINNARKKMINEIEDIFEKVPSIKNMRAKDKYFSSRIKVSFVSLNPKFPDYNKDIKALKEQIYHMAECMTFDGKPGNNKIMGMLVPQIYQKLEAEIIKIRIIKESNGEIPIISRTEFIMLGKSLKCNADKFQDEDFQASVKVLLDTDYDNTHIKNGIIERKNVRFVLGKDWDSENQDTIKKYLRLLWRFQIACEIDDHRVLVPPKLPVFAPISATSIKLSSLLTRYYFFNYVPYGFWTRFITRFLLIMKEMLSNPKIEIISRASLVDSLQKNKLNSFTFYKAGEKPSNLNVTHSLNIKSPENLCLNQIQTSLELSESKRFSVNSWYIQFFERNFSNNSNMQNNSKFINSHLQLTNNLDQFKNKNLQSECSHNSTTSAEETEISFVSSDNKDRYDDFCSCCNDLSYDDNCIAVSKSSDVASCMTHNCVSNLKTDCKKKTNFEKIIHKSDTNITSKVTYTDSSSNNGTQRFNEPKKDIPKLSFNENDCYMQRVDEHFGIGSLDSTTEFISKQDHEKKLSEEDNETNSQLINELSNNDEAYEEYFNDCNELAYLLDKGYLSCWNEGIIFNHPQLYFSIQQLLISVKPDQETIEIRVSKSPLGYRVLSYIVDHIRTLLEEWYEGLSYSDTVVSSLACPVCTSLDIKPYLINISTAFEKMYRCSQESALNVTCENNHVPKNVNIEEFCPDLTFQDLPKTMKFTSNDFQCEQNEKCKLGEGQFGKVYSGLCKNKIRAAIKFYKFKINNKDEILSSLNQFYKIRQEIVMLSKLRHHPYIIQFLGFSLKPELCVVMERASHGALSSVIHKKPQVIPRIVKFRICQQIASAVAFMHTKYIIHRDIKSDNILLFSLNHNAKINIKLTDFGTANFMSPSGMKTFFGTKGYTAPEMILYQSSLDEYNSSVDIYSFGIFLYELIAYRRPFHDVAEVYEIDHYVKKGLRPKFYDILDAFYGLLHLTKLMLSMWHQEPFKRPSAKDILNLSLSPTFQLIFGLKALSSTHNPCDLCYVKRYNQIWIACDDKEGQFVIVINMENFRIVQKFKVDTEELSQQNFNMSSITTISDKYVCVVLRSFDDVIIIYKAKKYSVFRIYTMEDSHILSISANDEWVCLGFLNGRCSKVTLKNFLNGSMLKNLYDFQISALCLPVTSLVFLLETVVWSVGRSIAYCYLKKEEEGMKPCHTERKVQEIVYSFNKKIFFISFQNSPEIYLHSAETKEILHTFSCRNDILSCSPKALNVDLRVTCMCSVVNMLWVGTGSGHILIYEVQKKKFKIILLLTLHPYAKELRKLVLIPTERHDDVKYLIVSTGKELNKNAFGMNTLVCFNDDIPKDEAAINEKLYEPENTGESNGKVILVWHVLPAYQYKNLELI
ncbi:leucine-rich repeat serine/threonine-protein kinase 2 isoform X5 [Hydra vulgaris]|uniref:Leucine-rich repeat serine/threonine-protein kinase 2 isoform X5 n=1 Tax=Hydra vulgaris TaxID=6087 RepID=A0ABM4CBY5_HYDVU